jgi:hypothetical protein
MVSAVLELALVRGSVLQSDLPNPMRRHLVVLTFIHCTIVADPFWVHLFIF